MSLSPFTGGKMIEEHENEIEDFKRRNFIKKLVYSTCAVLLSGITNTLGKSSKLRELIFPEGYNPNEHLWGMGIDINKCIGCGRCVDACKTENDVPREPYFFRTWVERYRIYENNEVDVDSPGGAINGFETSGNSNGNVIRSFFVPKLCNHCDNPPCVQVCPVGATFRTEDGVVLVDKDYCIGCRYCIQGCPYGARYLNPLTRTADKCTFCYHRIVNGLLPACVEVCPTQARVFGEVKKKASPLVRFLRRHSVNVLKPSLNTEPKIFYANMDMEVR
jgi:Fe-S-cluster-containing dehydrogenase component